ncbi:MAG: energy-coupling factor transporter transmembrane protein EcfT [Acidobacteriia bacterium]|nr:energy-coupling factor transporter transmembrane protein EcfT [Terriglobia bacterium]
MHHVLVDQWSQGSSPLHARDPRAKLLVLVTFLVALATTAGNAFPTLAVDAALLAAGALIAGLPLGRLLLRAMAILPFSVTFGIISWLAGEHLRAIALVEKSYLSTVAVLLLVGTTPLPRLLSGLEALGTPRLLVLLAQFLYRYLFVISEQAQHLRLAAACREGSSGAHRHGKFRAAAGALAVLFARSYYRAEGIHQAMLARAFTGRFSPLNPLRFGPADGFFTAVIGAMLILARIQ